MQNAWIYLLYSKLKCAFIIIYVRIRWYSSMWQVQPDPINILDGNILHLHALEQMHTQTNNWTQSSRALPPHALECLFYNLARTLLPLGMYVCFCIQSSHCRHPHSSDSTYSANDVDLPPPPHSFFAIILLPSLILFVCSSHFLFVC